MKNTPRMVVREIPAIVPYTEFTVSKKGDIYSRMSRYGCFTMGGSRDTSYSGYTSSSRRDGGDIYVYTAEKHRAKYDHKGRKASKTGKQLTHSTLIKAAHWKVRVYRFDLTKVKSVEQKTRTFKAVM